jgi:TonB family protein
VEAGKRGRLEVQFTLQPEGDVSDIRIDGLFDSRGLGRCVYTFVRDLRFDPPPKGGSVTYRYTFKLDPGPDRTYVIIP